MFDEVDRWHMRRALQLAAGGEGLVEPNPMVGCVVAQGAEIIGEGLHRRYGGPHAEVEALTMAAARAKGATLYVTLEPCCHQGKTPPCTRAVIAAGISRAVVAQEDPFAEVAGRGIAELRGAGITVDVGLMADDARRLNAPYLKLIRTGRPWIIAKWAMSLDGKLATRAGESRWISNEKSRAVVHQLRGRVDAILVGRGTADRDDPLLTARPPGPRAATRVILDTQASLNLESQLVRTARQSPVLLAVGDKAPAENLRRLAEAGCEVFSCRGRTHAERLDELLAELGRRRFTNVLVEGGAGVLGSLLDARAIDEVHVFVSPTLIGGASAPSAFGGLGIERIADALRLHPPTVSQLDGDLYLTARCLAGSLPGSPAARASCSRDR
jgi:diaminohydroxyphosphoribosylaminopyrimidine deaminase/5-amino-6-(5-phosphoribosylamino)uracil reductase